MFTWTSKSSQCSFSIFEAYLTVTEGMKEKEGKTVIFATGETLVIVVLKAPTLDVVVALELVARPQSLHSLLLSIWTFSSMSPYANEVASSTVAAFSIPLARSLCFRDANLVVATKFEQVKVKAAYQVVGLVVLEYIQMGGRMEEEEPSPPPLNGQERGDGGRKWKLGEQFILLATATKTCPIQSLLLPLPRAQCTSHTRGYRELGYCSPEKSCHLAAGQLLFAATGWLTSSMAQLRSMKRKRKSGRRDGIREKKTMMTEANPSSENCGIRFIREMWFVFAGKVRRIGRISRLSAIVAASRAASKGLPACFGARNKSHLDSAECDLESSSRQQKRQRPQQNQTSSTFCCQEARMRLRRGTVSFAILPLSVLTSGSHHNIKRNSNSIAIFEDIEQQFSCRCCSFPLYCSCCCCCYCCPSLVVDVKVDSCNEATVVTILTDMGSESTLMLAPASASSFQFRENVQNVFTSSKFVCRQLKVVPSQVKDITRAPSKSFNSSNNDQLHRELQITREHRKLLETVERELESKRGLCELSFWPKVAALKRLKRTMRGIQVVRLRIVGVATTTTEMMTTTKLRIAKTTTIVTIRVIVGTAKIITRSTSTIGHSRGSLSDVITVWFRLKLAPISSCNNALDLAQARGGGVGGDGGDAITAKSQACCRCRCQCQQQWQQPKQLQLPLFPFHWLVNFDNALSASITSLIGRNQAIQFACYNCCRQQCCPGLKLDLELELELETVERDKAKERREKPLALIHQTFRPWRKLECQNSDLEMRVCCMESKEKRSAPACESECHLVISSCSFFYTARFKLNLDSYSLSAATSHAAGSLVAPKVDQSSERHPARAPLHRGGLIERARRQADRSKKRSPREWSTTMRPTFNMTKGFKTATKTTFSTTETTLKAAATTSIVAVQNAAPSCSPSSWHLTSVGSKRGRMQAVVIFCLVIVACFAAELVTRDLKWGLEFALNLNVQKKRRPQERSTPDQRLQGESGAKSESNNHQWQRLRLRQRRTREKPASEVEVAESKSKRTYNRISMIDYTAKPMGECDKRQDQVSPNSSSSSNNNKIHHRAASEESFANFWPVIAISRQQSRLRRRSIKRLPESEEEECRSFKGRAKQWGSQQQQLGNVSLVRGLILASLLIYCVIVIGTVGVTGSAPVSAATGSNEIGNSDNNNLQGIHDTTPRIHPRSSGNSKLEFWRLLLQSVLSDISSEASSNANLDAAVTSLALKLASWPDQKRATLLYLDLLAERRDRMLGLTSANSQSLASGFELSSSSNADLICRRASLAQLEASEADLKQLEGEQAGEEVAATYNQGAHFNRQNFNKLKQFISLNELNNREATNKALIEKLNKQSKFSDLAKLAVENSNLISRLLIHSDENGVIKQIVSKETFFKYLLSSKVRKVSSSYLHSLGLIFLDYNQENEIGRDGDAGGRSFRVRENEEEDSANRIISRLRNRRIKFSPLAISNGPNSAAGEGIAPLLLDLAKHPVASDTNNPNAYFKVHNGTSQSQAFVAKWLLADELGELQALEQRLEALFESGRDGDSKVELDNNSVNNNLVRIDLSHSFNLNLDDGRWFSPYFDCGVSNTWLLTYSIPFFASLSGESKSAKPNENGDEGDSNTERGSRQRVVKLR